MQKMKKLRKKVKTLNIREIEKRIDEKTSQLVVLLTEINTLENERNEYYETQKSWCSKIKNIIKGNENHIPFV